MGSLHTLLNDRKGNDAPIRKPKKTPIKVVTISLVFSFAFLTKALKCNISNGIG